MIPFNSYKECRRELSSLLKVVNFLRDERDNYEEVYATLCNGNVIILGTLFESFTENIIQEYIDAITVEFNNRRLIYRDLPDGIKEYIAKKIVAINHKKDFEKMHYGQAIKLLEKFLNGLDQDGFLIDKELDGINKFSFGKHGESEVTKTFKRIGIDATEMLPDASELNNFFNLRNGIVHSDQVSMTIGTLPDPSEIRKYILLLYSYSKSVNEKLMEKLTNGST